MKFLLLCISVFFCNYSHSIINGHFPVDGRFDNTVFITNSITGSRCTGTIIGADNNYSFIETAAHCIYEFTKFDILLLKRNMSENIENNTISPDEIRVKAGNLYNEKLQFMKKGVRVYFKNASGNLEMVTIENTEINPRKLVSEKIRIYNELGVEKKNSDFIHDYLYPDLAVVKTKKIKLKNNNIPKLGIGDISIGDVVYTLGYGVVNENFAPSKPKKRKNVSSGKDNYNPDLKYSLGKVVKISEFGKIYIIGLNENEKYQAPCYGDSGGGNYVLRSGVFLYIGATSDMGSKEGCAIPSIKNESNNFLPKSSFTHTIEFSGL